jgi:hypothetical protein
MFLLGALLMAVCSSAYFLNSKLQLILYTNIQSELKREDMVQTALMPLLCPVQEEKKGGRREETKR